MKTIPANETGIYYTGDTANRDGFGKVCADVSDKWGSKVNIQLDDGRLLRAISISMIADKYDGHCGTRFVTREAYEAWRRQRIAESNAAIEAAALRYRAAHPKD